jgi:hypothetical protein
MKQLLVEWQFLPNFSFTHDLLRIVINGLTEVVNMYTKRMRNTKGIFPSSKLRGRWLQCISVFDIS